MSPSSDVTIVIAHRVATITINRPEQRNALTWDTVRNLRRALADCNSDTDVRVIVLRGAGNDAFCSGADLAAMGPSENPEERHEARGELAGLFRDVWALDKPVIARVAGFALAGGMGLALACDIVVASETATFGVPELNVGLWPFMVTIPLLQSMAPKHALELMMTGRRVSASEGAQLGFVNRCVPLDELDSTVSELAAILADQAPHAMRVGRSSFYRALHLDTDDALDMLHSLLSITAEGAEAAEGIAAFREKRPPSWRQ